MSTDLSRTLHATIDGEPAGVPTAFDMTRVRSRARRRRVARTATRGAVGVGAAGAVAVGAVQVSGRDASVLPPAVAGAPAGTCGSDTGALRGLPVEDALTLTATTDDANVAVQPPDAHEGALTSVIGPSVWLWPSFGGVRDLEAYPLVPRPDVETPPFVRVVLAHEGTVVGTSIEQTVVGGIPYSPTGWDPLVVPLVTCDEPGRPGGDALPAGDYEVYVAPDDGPLDAPVGSVSRSWTVRVVDQTAVSGLPADFPDDVPLVPGQLLDVRRLDDGGWFVEIATPADDRVSRAGALLDGSAPDAGRGPGASFYGTTLAEWTVEIKASQVDGVETVFYVLAPR
ncbi:hypothetical protein ACFO3K_16475 [Cellulomonas algicola]|uniref:hypothetical protein n=3 Tax=Cellulomonas algicola TaxID=2071633 RepID=UPI001C3F92DF|nr:hypothetical protein [Cellulomonas algicola]